MKKYGIELVKDDNTTILEVFASKEAALAAGSHYRALYPRDRGLLSCICAEFDECDRKIGNSYTLHQVWL